MSCGKPHETPCSDVLAKVYAYIDGELDQGDCGDIQQHLDECGPCLEEYGLDRLVKELVHKHCGQDKVPEDLRDKVLGRIAGVRAHLQVGEGGAVTD